MKYRSINNVVCWFCDNSHVVGEQMVGTDDTGGGPEDVYECCIEDCEPTGGTGNRTCQNYRNEEDDDYDDFPDDFPDHIQVSK